jgi:tetratricopeptide (TPR) repeat protein
LIEKGEGTSIPENQYMEKIRILLVIMFVMLCRPNIEASYKSDIYKAFINSDLTKWKKIIDQMDQQKNKSNDLFLELLNYQYGYIAWNLGNNKCKQAESYLEAGEKNIKILEKKCYQPAIVNSYKSAFYNFRVALYKLQAPFVIPKSVLCAKKAVKLDGNSYFAYIQLGNIEYYMPSILGGSKALAIKYYERALCLMEKDLHQLNEDWNYLCLLTMIALAWQDIGNYQKAKNYFNKILTIEPDYKWVREDLYPSLLKKIK